MQKIFNDRTHFFIALIIAFLIPVYPVIVPPFIVLLVLNWLMEPQKIIGGIKGLLQNKSLLMMPLLYLLYAIGVIYSADVAEGGHILERKLSLLILPLIFSARIQHTRENINTYLKAFIVGCIASGIIYIAAAFYAYLKPVYVMIDGAEYDIGLSNFYYAHLSPLIHPSYIALYFDFALFAVFYLTVKNEIRLNWKWYIAVLFMCVFVLLLSSKAGWIGLFLVAGYVCMQLLISKRWLASVAIAAVLAGLFYVFNISAPAYSQRLTSATRVVASSVTASEEKLEQSNDGTASRILVWKAAIDLIREDPLIGKGTGDAKEAMLQKYKEKGMMVEYDHKLNSHDQYLNTGVGLGIPGMILLLACLLLPLYRAVMGKQIILIAFILLCGMNFLFESMLETQSGVMFYAFFNTIFCFSYLHTNSHIKNQNIQ